MFICICIHLLIYHSSQTITIDLKDSHTSATAKMLQDWNIDDDSSSEPKLSSKHHVAEQKGVSSNDSNSSKALASDDYDDLLDLMDNCK
jgi:hypothetical protein